MSLDEATLRAWVEEVAGAPVAEWGLLTAGNSRRSWTLRAGERRLVLRQDTGGGPVAGTEVTLDREALVLGALGGRGIPLPALHAVHPSGEALLVDFVAGRADDHDAALDDLLGRVADLHRLDLGVLDLPGRDEPSIEDVRRWDRVRAARVGDGHPLADTAARLLLERHPGEPERTVLCHGDVGAGNLLHEDGHVTGLLDWEFWHVGDPHDDLAWITVRAALLGEPVPRFGERVRRHYAPRSGVALEPARLRYWQAVCLWRTLLCCLSMVRQPEAATDRLLHVMLLPVLERQTVHALARLVGVALEPSPPLPAPRDLPGTVELQAIAAALAETVGAVDDPDVALALRRMRRLAGQLADTWSLAPAIADADAADLAAAPADDVPARLRALGCAADRRLALFPGSRRLAEAPLAVLEQ